MVEKQRVKGFYQKPDPTFHPFGTDGQLIDMLSGLNLQEQLKIGIIPDNFIIDADDQYSFKVIQIYNDKNDNIAYSVVTTTTQLTNQLISAIQQENAYALTFNQYFTESEFEALGLAAQEIRNSNILQATVISITLYKGEYDPEDESNKIKSKITIIPEVVS